MHLLGWVAVLFYAAAEALAIRSLVRPKGFGAAPALVVAGLVAQFADLQLVGRKLGSVPYRTLGGSMALFGWMLGLAYLVLVLRHRERAIGPFLIPLLLAFSLLGVLLPSRAPAAPGTRGSLFAFHVTFAILADAAFALSFVLSILYLIQNRQIRRGRTGVLFSRLPSLEVIGRMNRTSVTIGLVVLSLSVALGMAWAHRVWNGRVLPNYGFQGGGKTLQEAGAIFADNLSPQKARILLMLALQTTAKAQEIQRLFDR